MQQHHVPVEEAHCFPMLRICYNQQRLKWFPGGYPPKAGSMPRIADKLGPAGLRLLQVRHAFIASLPALQKLAHDKLGPVEQWVTVRLGIAAQYSADADGLPREHSSCRGAARLAASCC